MKDERELGVSEFAEGYRLGARLGYEAGKESCRKELMMQIGQNPVVRISTPSRFASIVSAERERNSR
jgi:hypothetical protein